jgi:hypothetical protein
MRYLNWTYPVQLDLSENRLGIVVDDYVIFVSPYPSGSTTVLLGRYMKEFTKDGELYASIRLGSGHVVDVLRDCLFHIDELELVKKALSFTLACLGFEYLQLSCMQYCDWNRINVEFRDLIHKVCPMEDMMYYTGQDAERINEVINRIVSGDLRGIKPHPSERGNVPTEKFKSSFNSHV